METIRQLCGEEGMLDLATRSVVAKTTPDSGIEHDNFLPIEQSFATEGVLWFPNLFLPDPTIILPFILSGVVFACVHHNSKVIRSAETDKTLIAGIRREMNILKLGSLAVVPATLLFPSPMLLYWITSALCGLVWDIILYRLLNPKRNPPGVEVTSKGQQFRGPKMQDLPSHKKKK